MFSIGWMEKEDPNEDEGERRARLGLQSSTW